MTGATDRREAVRLAGTVVDASSAPCLWRAAAERRRESRGRDGQLVVQIDDARVVISVSSDALVDDGETDEGAWSELFERHRPPLGADWVAAFTRARLTTVTVAAGASVEIYGEVLERGPGQDGGPRESPTLTLRRVRGLVVSCASDRARRVARAVDERFPPAARAARPSWSARRAAARAARKRDPRAGDPATAQAPRDPIALVFTILLLALAGVGAGLGIATGLAAPWSFALVALVGVVVFRPGPPLRPFHVKGDLRRGAVHLSSGWTFLAGLLHLVALPAALTSEHWMASLYALALIAVTLMTGALGVRTYAAFRRMRRAPRWDGQLGVWAAVEGVVRDPTPACVGGTDVALASATGFEEGLGSNPDTVLWTRFHDDGTFLVDARPGVVEVSSNQIVWTTSVERRLGAADGPADYQIAEVIPIGGRVLAVGRIEAGAPGGPAQLRAHGTRPALLVATSGHGDPREWLARLARHRRATAVALAALAVALVRHLGGVG